MAGDSCHISCLFISFGCLFISFGCERPQDNRLRRLSCKLTAARQTAHLQKWRYRTSSSVKPSRPIESWNGIGFRAQYTFLQHQGTIQQLTLVVAQPTIYIELQLSDSHRLGPLGMPLISHRRRRRSPVLMRMAPELYQSRWM